MKMSDRITTTTTEASQLSTQLEANDVSTTLSPTDHLRWEKCQYFIPHHPTFRFEMTNAQRAQVLQILLYQTTNEDIQAIKDILELVTTLAPAWEDWSGYPSHVKISRIL